MSYTRSRARGSAASLLIAFAFTLSLPTPVALTAEGASPEYLHKLRALPPRDVGACVDLALWCRGAGLSAEASRLLEKALAMDPDCAPAREALGFRRYGAGWRRGDEKVLPPRWARPGLVTPSGGAVGGTPPPEVLATPASRDAPTAAEAPEEPAVALGPDAVQVEAPGTTTVDAETVEPPVEAGEEAASGTEAPGTEAKKAWAMQAFGLIAATCQTYEDKDFLVHSSLPTSSRQVRTLVASLRDLKRKLLAMVGTTTNAALWPDKLQVVLLKSEPEYERFAGLVDKLPSAINPDGAYTVEDRIVLHKLDSAALPRIVAETGLRGYQDSKAWTAWWYVEGMGEHLVAQSPAGQTDGYYAKMMLRAAEIMEKEGEGASIYSVIETVSNPRKGADRGRALALSLVDFLLRSYRSGFTSALKALKSSEAPVPPARDSNSGADFDSFFVSYLSFQEQTLEKALRLPVATLQERWKAYTLKLAERLRAESKPAPTDTAPGGKKRKKN